MFLPESVLLCIQTLNRAGFEAYAVGGCVRDSLLGLIPQDYDLCTNAAPADTARLFFDYTLVRSGEKHGTIGVVINKEVYEITTFRTEGGYQDSRHPDWVRFVSNITEDLARRDFTVNAMAYSPATGYIDPFGGQQDLRDRILRTVGNPDERFREDALRILRGVRFAVRFHLSPEEKTLRAMCTLAPLMDKLARERIFSELCKLLPLMTGEDLLRYAPVITRVIPELSPSVGFSQRTPHHVYDVFTHTAHVLEASPSTVPVRLAALLHDIGKPACFYLDENGRGHFKGHAQISARMADELLLRLKAPTALRQQVVFLIEHHMTAIEPNKKVIRRWLGKHGQQAVLDLLSLQEADFIGKGTKETPPAFESIRTLLQQVLAEEACLTIKNLRINGLDLQKAGFAPGPRMGECLQFLLEQVQDECIPNEPHALLNAAKQFLQE